MSTYNGEKYLEEQLESINKQSYKPFKLLIRDDGSRDSTLTIIEKFKSENINVQIIQGNNIGVQKSFLSMFDYIGKDCTFLALCDQDDYWEPDKLEIAIKYLKDMAQGTPNLYCSNLKVSDEHLNILKISKDKKLIPAFGNSLVENIATGCTIVMNLEAVELIRKNVPNISNIRMHDWWIYQVISAFGFVKFDENSYIYYRQHGNNTVGGDKGIINKWHNRLKRNIRGRNLDKVLLQVNEFKRVFYDKLDKENKILLDSFLNSNNNFKNKFSFLLNRKIYRQSKIDNIMFKILRVIGLIN